MHCTPRPDKDRTKHPQTQQQGSAHLAEAEAEQTHLQDQEKGHLQQLQSLMPGYRARPSLLGPVAAAAGLSLGAAAGLLPTKLSHAITGMLRCFLTHAHCLIYS